jgi:hypothetical protein
MRSASVSSWRRASTSITRARDAGFVGHDAEQRVATDRQHVRGLHGERGYQVGPGHEELGLAEGMAGIDQFQHAFVAAPA